MRFGLSALALVFLAVAAPAAADVSKVPPGGADGSKAATASADHHATQARGPASTKTGRRGEKGVVVAVRESETFRIRVGDARGRISDSALRAFRSLMRQGAMTHPPDPRLVALVGVVSDHFEGRTLKVVSGYRASSPYNPHSNHGFGRALDFTIDGINNEDLWAFCKTLRNAGCGYYPNSGFVHLDVRSAKASWIDRSLPGDPPDYDSPEGLAVGSGRGRGYPGGV
jgi:uncharacterized protein YcbK (DUF882 family)